jgi:putative ABC transport system permease protein
MIQQYFSTAFRQMSRRPGISLTYVAGLTLGIASSLLIFLIVKQEHSFDGYHTKASRIYRVEAFRVKEGFATAGIPKGATLPLGQEFEEIQEVVPIKVESSQLISVLDEKNKTKFKERIAFTQPEIFNLLDYKWIAGNPITSLTQPYSVVISASYAQKFFGRTTQAIGKTIRLNNQHDLLITGILADYPNNTDFAFTILSSYATYKSLHPEEDFTSWNSIDDNHQTFILLQEGIDPATLEKRFPALIKKYMDEEATKTVAFQLLPLEKLHFSHNFGGRTADPILLESLSLVAGFILLLACVNFINLSTAQGAKRAKEVGVRKVLGSNRIQLIYQFLTEASIITFLSLVLSVGIAFMAKSYVTQMLNVAISPALFFSLSTFIFLVTVFLATSLLAGLYPAFVLSGFTPVQAIKNLSTGKFSRKVILRNSLVVFQFSVSLLLIIGTFVVSQQLNLFRQAPLGFTKEAIITVEIPENERANLEVLRQKLLASPQIKQVSFSLNSASAETNWMQSTQYKPEKEEIDIRTQMKWVDADFIETYGIQLIAGQALQEGDSLSTILVNEVYVQRMKLASPQEAVGKVIHGLAEKPLPIVGVVKNFHVNSLHQKIDPTILAILPKFFHQGTIKLQQTALSAESIEKAIHHIGKAWTSTFPEHVFTYQFLDHTLEEAYKKEIQTAKMINIATAIAVSISCLGLFGLAVFITGQRIKEIGIRKVLGASTGNILMLLSKEFLKLVLLANVMAWPLAWWLLNKWLENFEFRIHIGPGVFILAAFSTLFITLLTISYQSVKAALANPVKSLRTE